MIIEIPLSRGKYFALVDETDAERVRKLTWHRVKGGANYYAESQINGKRIKMHRFILGDAAWAVTDHDDGNGLNNTRANLRPCTSAQNSRNKTRLMPTNTSGVTGVGRSPKGDGWWRVTIRCAGKSMYLGDYDSLAQAAGVRRKAELDHFGEFAPKNSKWEPLERIRRRVKQPPKPKRVKPPKPIKLTLEERRELRATTRGAAQTEMRDLCDQYLDILTL